MPGLGRPDTRMADTIRMAQVEPLSAAPAVKLLASQGLALTLALALGSAAFLVTRAVLAPERATTAPSLPRVGVLLAPMLPRPSEITVYNHSYLSVVPASALPADPRAGRVGDRMVRAGQPVTVAGQTMPIQA